MLDLGRVRRRLVELAEIAEEPALVEGLERVLALARAVRKTSSKRAAVTPRSQTQKREPKRRRALRKK